MFVDPTTRSDWNSGLSPDQPLKISEDRTGVVMVSRGVYPGKLFFYDKKEKKELEEWPPKVDNLNEEWWK